MAACLGLRLTGLDHGLPHRMEPDAEVVTQVEVMRGEHEATSAYRAGNYGTYPLLIAQLTTLLFEGNAPLESGVQPGLEEHLERASRNFLDTRRTVALFSILIVPATFLLACSFVSPGWALLAAALAAFSLLDQNFSQQARSHGMLAPLMCLTMVAALRLRRRGDWGSYVLAAVACALALGCLHSAVAMWPALLVAHFLVGDGERILAPRIWLAPRSWFAPKAWLAIGLIFAAIPLFYPFVFEGAQDTEVGVPRMEGSSLWLGNHEIDFALFDGGGFLTLLRTFEFYEPVLGLLLLVALAALVWRASAGRPAGLEQVEQVERPVPGPGQRRDLLVVLTYVLPYLLVIGLFRETFERFLLPLLPFCAVFAAWGVRELVARIAAPALRRVMVACVCLLLLLPASASARLAWLRSQPDTGSEAAAWMSAHLEPGAEPIFLSPVPSAHRSDSSMELPLLRTPDALRQARGPKLGLYNIWSVYQLRLPDLPPVDAQWPIRWLVSRIKDLGVPPGVGRLEHLERTPQAFFATSGPGLFVIEVYEQRDQNPTHIYLRGALQSLGTRLARFSPDGPEHDTRFPLIYQDRVEDGGAWPNYFRRVFTARTTGPVIEIYRVEAAALGR